MITGSYGFTVSIETNKCFGIFLYSAGPVCNRTWDGWLCWDDTEPGFTSEQHCPDYFQDFDPKGEC